MRIDINHTISYTDGMINLSRRWGNMAGTVKIAISVEKELYNKAEKLAAKMQITRSKLYSIALEKFLMEKENEFLLREINENYQESDPGEEKILNAMKKYREKTIEMEEW
jgi:metal-responsive CopG/Arc/MetJ family transcriptional regulator